MLMKQNLAQNDFVQGADVVLRRREAHLNVGEVENKVLALVANVVTLEAEEEGKPVQEVHVRGPLVVRRLLEVADGSKRSGNLSDGCSVRRLWMGIMLYGPDSNGGAPGLGRVWLGLGLGGGRYWW